LSKPKTKDLNRHMKRRKIDKTRQKEIKAMPVILHYNK